MVWLVLILIAFVTSWLSTRVVRYVAPAIDFVDKPGGRKVHAKVTPLGGGVAIFLSIAFPLVLALFAVPNLPANVMSTLGGGEQMLEKFSALQRGVLQQRSHAVAVLVAVLAMHVLGLIDDRRALGPYTKLFAQLGIAGALAGYWSDLRLLTAAGEPWSFVLTVLWITAITNAFNFLDNMDGLSAGIAAVAAGAFLITTLAIGQYFIAAGLCLLLGACLGFLCYNFAPASIFMGDSGSLVIGFLLAVLTVRTTFLPPGQTLVSSWYTLFAPLMVLAVPLYDLCVVSLLRVREGRSPFRGDTNHLSHRLVRRGMSKPGAVVCIYLFTAATSIAAVVLPHVHSAPAALLLFAQTLMVLTLVYLLERGEGLVVWHPPVRPPASPVESSSEPAAEEAPR
jgi:UDP-GlcNAc:undecaprenyl-phosphate GlcNAc-1-phosphate transferase